MEKVEVPVEKAIPIAEFVLAVFIKVRDIVEKPLVWTKEMQECGLTPHRIAAIHLAEAMQKIGEVITLPTKKDESGTCISRESISMMLKPPIQHLASFIVRARRAQEIGTTLPPHDAYKALMLSAIIARTLCAATGTFPSEDSEKIGGAANAGTFC